MKIRWIVPSIVALFLLVQGVFAMQTIKLIVNNKEIKPDVPPQLIQGRVFVPVRTVAEALQAEVKWDELSNTVTITQKKPTQEVIAEVPEVKASLLAVEREGIYEKFELRVGDQARSFPSWRSSSSRPQQLIFSDIDRDGNKEIIVLLTVSSGNGVDTTEAHVIKTGNMLEDVYVDHPLAVIYKNVKTKVDTDEIKIKVGGENYSISKDKLSSPPENWYSNIHFGKQISFNVLDNQLTAHLSGQISPTEYIGEVVITYELKDMMFQAASLKYKPLSGTAEEEQKSLK